MTRVLVVLAVAFIAAAVACPLAAIWLLAMPFWLHVGLTGLWAFVLAPVAAAVAITASDA